MADGMADSQLTDSEPDSRPAARRRPVWLDQALGAVGLDSELAEPTAAPAAEPTGPTRGRLRRALVALADWSIAEPQDAPAAAPSEGADSPPPSSPMSTSRFAWLRHLRRIADGAAQAPPADGVVDEASDAQLPQPHSADVAARARAARADLARRAQLIQLSRARREAVRQQELRRESFLLIADADERLDFAAFSRAVREQLQQETLTDGVLRRVFSQLDQGTGKICHADFEYGLKRWRFLSSIVSSYCSPSAEVCEFAPVAADYDWTHSTADNYDEARAGRAGPSEGFEREYAFARDRADYSYHVRYTRERQRWQNAVVRGVVTRTEAQPRPWLVFTCGPMGAGKGYALSWMSEHGHFPLESIVHVDPDHFRRLMPEWQEYRARDPTTAGSLTHLESCFLQARAHAGARAEGVRARGPRGAEPGALWTRERAAARALRVPAGWVAWTSLNPRTPTPAGRGLHLSPRLPTWRSRATADPDSQELATEAALRDSQHVWVDGSLRDGEWLSRVLDDVRERYPAYRVAIIHVHASEAVVRRRCAERAARTGRAVPESLVHETLTSPEATLRRVTHKVDFVARVNNDDDGLPRLEALQTVDRSGQWAAIASQFSRVLLSTAEFPDALSPLPVARTRLCEGDLDQGALRALHGASGGGGGAGAQKTAVPLSEAALRRMPELARLRDALNLGVGQLGLTLSSVHAINIDEESRALAHVPLAAYSCAYNYPSTLLAELAIDAHAMAAAGLSAGAAELELLLYGGFVHFDLDDRVVAVNAFTREPAARHMVQFGAAEPLAAEMGAALAGRWQQVTWPELAARDVASFCWICPGEKLANRRVAPFGALAFSYRNYHGTGAARSLSAAARKLDVAEALLADRLFPVLGKCGLQTPREPMESISRPLRSRVASRVFSADFAEAMGAEGARHGERLSGELDDDEEGSPTDADLRRAAMAQSL